MSGYFPKNARVYEAQKACQWMQERGTIQNLSVGYLLVTNRETPSDEIWKCLGKAKGFDFGPYGERVLADCEWTQEDNYLAGLHRANVELAEAEDSESPRRIAAAQAEVKKAQEAFDKFKASQN